MNVPNVLTILRIILTFFFIKYALDYEFITATSLFIVAAVTDYADGYIARRYNLVTNLGKILDPIADKFLVLAAFLIFAHIGVIYDWMAWLIFLREVSVTIYRFYAMSKKSIIAAEKLGKYKTVAQILTIIIVLMVLILSQSDQLNATTITVTGLTYWIIQILMVITLYYTLLSGWQFFRNNLRVTT